MTRVLSVDAAEALACKMRSKLCSGSIEPLNVKTVLRQLNILTLYRPLSDRLWGLSLKSPEGTSRFMLVNSNSTRGRQHFTIAHELYHLYFDDNPSPHFCGNDNQLDVSERSANMFASALLMPKEGLCQYISSDELKATSISIDTALKLEALFGVSHLTLMVRLKELRLISKEAFERMKGVVITNEAALRGYDGSLYKNGNSSLVIGDFGVLAKNLYDVGKISESHFLTLLNMIGYGEGEDSSGL